MHKHTVLVSKRELGEYLDERRLTIGKAQSYINQNASKRLMRRLVAACVVSGIVLISLILCTIFC